MDDQNFCSCWLLLLRLSESQQRMNTTSNQIKQKNNVPVAYLLVLKYSTSNLYCFYGRCFANAITQLFNYLVNSCADKNFTRVENIGHSVKQNAIFCSAHRPFLKKKRKTRGNFSFAVVKFFSPKTLMQQNACALNYSNAMVCLLLICTAKAIAAKCFKALTYSVKFAKCPSDRRFVFKPTLASSNGSRTKPHINEIAKIFWFSPLSLFQK